MRPPDADPVLLREHDVRAHEEALESGGLFKGHANDRCECIAFCLWETRDRAIEAANAVAHGSAANITARTYLLYALDRYRLKRTGGKLVFERI